MVAKKQETMTQEDKKLLLKDLCARLPYGVIVDYKEDEYDFHNWKISTLHAPAYSQSGSLINTDSDGWIAYEEHKGCGMSTGSRPLNLETTLPFLRPMSSMTDEERKELRQEQIKDEQLFIDCIKNHPERRGLIIPHFAADWCNKNMFDYRGLIPMGLALEVTKENNPYK